MRGWCDSFKADVIHSFKLYHNLIEGSFSLLDESLMIDGISNLKKYSIMFLQGHKFFLVPIVWDTSSIQMFV